MFKVEVGLSTLWVWTQSAGVQVLEGRHPVDCDDARNMSEKFFMKNEELLCCHHFEIKTGTDAGTQDVYLVWVCNDYKYLVDFLNTPAGEKYKNKTGEIPPPSLPGPKIR
ncbi:hypothetical protein mvi_65730 (plasmid) [Methylobacterium indicum]|uniref:Uncharacterized protein n=1 Tax=Methylobacterium indicum TaxID=1775910 RepID=A0A8H9C9G1_9HYPH|nr:hypothetical protein mvi_65730 [Methylobacterium indicum]